MFTKSNEVNCCWKGIHRRIRCSNVNLNFRRRVQKARTFWCVIWIYYGPDVLYTTLCSLVFILLKFRSNVVSPSWGRCLLVWFLGTLFSTECETLLAPVWTNTPRRLSATTFSINSHLRSIFGGRLLHPQPENAPCLVCPLFIHCNLQVSITVLLRRKDYRLLSSNCAASCAILACKSDAALLCCYWVQI
jgi:hypothetical protein